MLPAAEGPEPLIGAKVACRRRSPTARSSCALIEGDPGADLTRIALEIARDAYPGLDIDPYFAKIGALADEYATVARPAPAPTHFGPDQLGPLRRGGVPG